MATATNLTVNGKKVTVDVAGETPLLYVLRNDLNETSPRFGCGLAQCGACTVQVDGVATRSCVTPLSAVANKKITTLAGLAASYQTRSKQGEGTLHPVQAAFIEHQAAQCGYCLNGWVMTAAAYLDKKPGASEAEIREALAGIKCRCGSHMSILRAVKAASNKMAKEAV
jgi:nicotinate dehydrogenase subunit A